MRELDAYGRGECDLCHETGPLHHELCLRCRMIAETSQRRVQAGTDGAADRMFLAEFHKLWCRV